MRTPQANAHASIVVERRGSLPRLAIPVSGLDDGRVAPSRFFDLGPRFPLLAFLGFFCPSSTYASKNGPLADAWGSDCFGPETRAPKRSFSAFCFWTGSTYAVGNRKAVGELCDQ